LITFHPIIIPDILKIWVISIKVTSGSITGNEICLEVICFVQTTEQASQHVTDSSTVKEMQAVIFQGAAMSFASSHKQWSGDHASAM